MIVIDFRLVPPSNITYSVKSILGCNLGAGHVVSGKVVVAVVSQSVSPLPTCPEAKIVDGLTIRRESRLSGSYEADALVFALAL